MRLSKLAIALLALMLTLTACGGGGGEAEADKDAKPTETAEAPADEATEAPAEEPTEEEPAKDAGEDVGEIEGDVASIRLGEPKWLIPQNSTETEGSQVLNALFSPLVGIDKDNLPVWGDEAPNVVAKEITNNEDNTVFTVTLKEGWTFHNGEPVDAESYLRGWNWAADPENAAEASYFFENIAGYAEVQDGKAETMSGLKAIDEHTIEITMATAFAPMTGALGYTAFYPLPKAALDDIDAFNEAPIGNGPFQMHGKWNHDVDIWVKRYEDYGGGQPAKLDGIEFRIYTELATSYNDVLAGSLDVADVPTENLGTYQDELGGRFYTGPSSSFMYLGIPRNAGDLTEKKELRQALSLAIDRQTISDQIFSGANTPADDFVSPLVAGYREGACEYCKHDPEAAKKMWDEAGGPESFNIWFNAGSGHEEWVEAVANGWKKTLGVTSEFQSMQWAEYLKKLEAHEADGPYRLGWAMDYPSSQNYLSIWMSTSTSNYSMYSNEAFDKFLQEGNAAKTLEESLAKYNAADDLILEDMPGLPMFFGTIHMAHSENVKNLYVDQFTHIDVVNLELAS